MLTRLRCLLLGHRLQLMGSRFIAPVRLSEGSAWDTLQVRYDQAFGFSLLYRVCSRCGCTRIMKLRGDWSELASAANTDGEIAQLRKMMGLG